jgi:hypothetical protein
VAQTWTTTELLAQIRDDARLADDDPEATDAILLRRATRILQDSYAPAVRNVRGDYYVTVARIALASGRAGYPIPRRAVTSSVRRVRVLDANRRVVNELMPVSLEDISRDASAACPSHYSIADERILVWPLPNAATYTIEVMFEYRPSQLVLPAAAFTALYAFTSATRTHTLTCSADAGIDVGERFDVVATDAPFSTPLLDAEASSVTSGDTVIATTNYMGVQEDLGYSAATAQLYLCNAGETPIPQIPAELHPCLAMHTAAEFLIPIDPAGAQQLKLSADEKMARALSAMQPRKQGQQTKMRPRVRFVNVAGGVRGRNTFGDLS